MRRVAISDVWRNSSDTTSSAGTHGETRTAGTRYPPSQAMPFWPLNGETPPSGKLIFSAPLSVVKTTIVLSSWPMSSSFFST